MCVSAAVRQLNRQLAQDIHLLDAEINNYTSPVMKQSPAAAAAVPARSHGNAAAGAPVYRRR